MSSSNPRLSNSSVLWEAIAPVARWPLYSPARFFGIIGAVVLALWAWSGAAGDEGPAGPVELEPPSLATAAAGEFMGTWGDPEAERGEWRSQVQSLGTYELAQAWSETDPSQIPVSVTEELTPVQVSEEQVTYSVRTDGPRVQLVLVKEPGAWKVASVEPEVTS